MSRPREAPAIPFDLASRPRLQRRVWISPAARRPAQTLAVAGIGPGQDVVVEVTAGGLRIAADARPKVYVESTSHCNLDCTMCVRHGWQDPSANAMERFERLLDGLPKTAADPITIAFGGFGSRSYIPSGRG